MDDQLNQFLKDTEGQNDGEGDFKPPAKGMESLAFQNKISYETQKNDQITAEIDELTGLPKTPGAIEGKDFLEEPALPEEKKPVVHESHDFRKITPVAFDIETFQNLNMKPEYREHVIEETRDHRLKDPVKIEADIEAKTGRFALSSRTGSVIMCGFYEGIDNYVCFGANKESEKKILTMTWDYIVKVLNKGGRLVSFGGKRFDLPYLFERAIINDIAIPKLPLTLSELTHQYISFRHLDLEKIFTGGGLAEWAYLLGESTSFINDGAEIDGWYKAGNVDKIRDKNRADLEYTLSVYNKVKGWW